MNIRGSLNILLLVTLMIFVSDDRPYFSDNQWAQMSLAKTIFNIHFFLVCQIQIIAVQYLFEHLMIYDVLFVSNLASIVLKLHSLINLKILRLY